jgi:transglutaminase-like putative cysteine protease
VLRTAAVGALAASLLTWSWLRLEVSPDTGSVVRWALLVGVLPALVRPGALRAAAAVVAALIGVREALATIRPGLAADRFGEAFARFYDVSLPFDALFQPKMHGLILLAVLAFTLAASLAAAARRPLLAAGLVVAGSGWPATLLQGSRPLVTGAILLAAALAIVAVFSASLRPREASVAGALVVAAAVGVATVPAVAKGAFLAWERWDPYPQIDKPVSVSYVWDTSYRSLTWPKKRTVVFRAQGPPLSRYWRATTLDVFHGENWIEYPHALYARPLEFAPLLPRAARDPRNQLRTRIEIEALQGIHLLSPSVPVGFETDFRDVRYQETGTAIVAEGVTRGSTYTAISYLARAAPARLIQSQPVYGADDERYRVVQSRWRTSVPPAFGAPRRGERMEAYFRSEANARVYRRLYELARQVVGETSSPYVAAVRLENWFRSGGGFRYDETPPQSRAVPTPVYFVTRSRAGYCQHFASSMALMLRYLGVPARVAAGFTSGRYDQEDSEWTVTDHDAHTWVEVWFRGFGWLPFDPTPGRGTLDGAYSAASTRFNAAALEALGAGLDAADRKLNDAGLEREARAAADAGRDVPGDVATTTSDEPSLLRLLLLVALALLAAVTLTKQVLRRGRLLAREPRRAAAAYRRELADFLTDQRIAVPESATVAELGELVRHELGVNAEPFVNAVDTARYGPPERAAASARAARRELRRLQRDLRTRLSHVDRARGLVSLRSLGVT